MESNVEFPQKFNNRTSVGPNHMPLDTHSEGSKSGFYRDTRTVTLFNLIFFVSLFLKFENFKYNRGINSTSVLPPSFLQLLSVPQTLSQIHNLIFFYYCNVYVCMHIQSFSITLMSLCPGVSIWYWIIYLLYS